MVATDLHEEAPVWWLRVKQAAERGATLVVLNARPTRLDKFATRLLHHAPGGAAGPMRELLAADDADAPAGSPAAVSAMLPRVPPTWSSSTGAEGLTGDETDTLARAAGQPAAGPWRDEDAAAPGASTAVWCRLGPRQRKARGTWASIQHMAPATRHIGGRDAPIFMPGQPTARGGALRDGADPVGDGLMDGRGKLSFLVVQELFLTETAALADVVLSGAKLGRTRGHIYQRRAARALFPPAIGAMARRGPIGKILAQLGERVGLGKPPFAAGLVFNEIAKVVPQYRLDYRALGHVEPQWPIVGGADMYYGGTAMRTGRIGRAMGGGGRVRAAGVVRIARRRAAGAGRRRLSHYAYPHALYAGDVDQSYRPAGRAHGAAGAAPESAGRGQLRRRRTADGDRGRPDLRCGGGRARRCRQVSCWPAFPARGRSASSRSL